MMYTPPKHIGLINASALATDRDLGFTAEALRIQLAEAARAWGWSPPGAAVYSSDTWIPAKEGAAVFIVDTDGNPNTAGVHFNIGGVPAGLVDMRDAGEMSVVASHECLEMLGNLYLTEWCTDSLGRKHSRELSDAVQAITYLMPVTMFGEERQIRVSDYLLPSWFLPDGKYPYDRSGVLTRPFQIADGGYSVALDGDEVLELSAGQCARVIPPGGRRDILVMAARKILRSRKTETPVPIL